MRRGRLIPLLWAAALAACGPLPRPFEEETAAPLAGNPALTPVEVEPVAQAPGLAERLAKALRSEDIAASTEGGWPTFFRLQGTVRDDTGGQRLIWRLTAQDGQLIGETGQSIAGWPPDPGQAGGLAAEAARSVAGLIRGSDSGISDLDARPRVTVRPVQADASLDADGLRRAMGQALAVQGLAVDDAAPAFLVDGKLRVTPGEGGSDLVEVTWTVRDASGKELGKVSQGSPVAHDLLVGQLGSLAHDIAGAGAGGVAAVIERSRKGP